MSIKECVESNWGCDVVIACFISKPPVRDLKRSEKRSAVISKQNGKLKYLRKITGYIYNLR